MSLDLTKVAAQVSGMVARLKAGDHERREHLASALETLRNVSDLNRLKAKIAQSQTTWLVAVPVAGLGERLEPPPPPGNFAVIATDGSHIEVDRHRAARCYLINIGAVTLVYGANPAANLASLPELCSEPDELVMTPEKGREQTVEGNLLSARRSVEECRHLAALARGLPKGDPTLALLDGSLILWGLEAYPDFVAETLLDKGFLPCLEEMRTLNADRRLALASYISFPRSTDVLNTLRVAVCPQEAADCDRYCPGRTRECDSVAGVQDRELFISLLGDGERSALFLTQSRVVEKHYGEHRVCFFYLRVGDEIARVEVPRWVAQDEGLLGLAHSLVLDQCRRGLGYPVALAEAHEQAVVTAADKEGFWHLVESLMLAEKMPTPTSAKRFSKKTRWL